MSRRVASVVLGWISLVLAAVALSGCGPATIEGKWVLSDGTNKPIPRTFANGWCIRSDGTKVKYATSGTSTLTFTTSDGKAEVWRYALNGDSLKLTYPATGKTQDWLREGSKAATDLHAEVDCFYIRASLRAAAIAAAGEGGKTTYQDVLAYVKARGVASDILGAQYVTKGTAITSPCPSGGTYTIRVGQPANAYSDTQVRCSVHGQG